MNSRGPTYVSRRVQMFGPSRATVIEVKDNTAAAAVNHQAADPILTDMALITRLDPKLTLSLAHCTIARRDDVFRVSP